MSRLRLWHTCAVLAFLLCAGMGTAQTTRTHPLTIENLIDIKHPSNPVWSPDGKRAAFLWDRADIVNLYLVNADGRSARSRSLPSPTAKSATFSGVRMAAHAASGTLHVDEEVITVEKLRKLMEWGGKWIGLGSGRPQGFGRFAVSSWIVDGKEYGAGVTGQAQLDFRQTM